jgi:uncharacterized membrane protein (DUF4010 family)
LIFYRRSTNEVSAPLTLNDPFSITTVLQFTGMLAIISVAATLIGRATGDGMGLPALAFASGLVDVDPITLSMAKMAAPPVGYGYAALVILTAAGANLFAKSCCTVIFGGWRVGIPLVVIGVLAGVVAGSTALILR